ncbi:uncharacterized protein DEA37_0002277 [Paragonimus westermani]|uniref:Uncharacterized protein n=1 Tax=Paragonimus westermani TaxID=34504 RepID=A0A5J4NVF7_9TREM|nr:uncharacterized protein DEA37_0002277 [Paragonimus westermani]
MVSLTRFPILLIILVNVYVGLVSGIQFETVLQPQTRRIRPADSYQILGKPGIRFMGQCNITYAWLIPPPASSLDAYGHALACTRLQLKDGRVIHSSLDDEAQHKELNIRSEEELQRMNKDLFATMVDLNRLDALMRAESLSSGGNLITVTGSQLADGNRYFYLGDRVGNLNIMVLLRPGQQLKLELIDPISLDHLVTPQHVLCTRKQCPISSTDREVPQSHMIKSASNSLFNSTQTLSTALSRTERHNRELYTQLIISRVACALLSFLCIVFAVTSLTLCVRLRKYPGYYRSKNRASDLSVCRDPHSTPTYFQPNGKLNMGQASPIYLAETTPKHAGLADSASVSNMVMTASNLSECAGIPSVHTVPISYTPLTPAQYAPLPAYPVSAGRASVYNDATGMLTFVPVNSRGILLPYQNGSTSPAPSHHSLNETKTGIVRTGSLGRYSGSSVYYGEPGRRKYIRLNKHPYSNKQADYQNSNSNHPVYNPRDKSGGDETEKVRQDFQMQNDLISFQKSDSCQLPVIYRYSSEPQHQQQQQQPQQHHFQDQSPAPAQFFNKCESVNGDRSSTKSAHMNHIPEPCIALTRKPALAN